METGGTGARGMHRLRTLRLEQAWTQEDLARESDVSVGTIARLETGVRSAYPSTVKKLARALRVEPRVLVNCGPAGTPGEAAKAAEG